MTNTKCLELFLCFLGRSEISICAVWLDNALNDQSNRTNIWPFICSWPGLYSCLAMNMDGVKWFGGASCGGVKASSAQRACSTGPGAERRQRASADLCARPDRAHWVCYRHDYVVRIDTLCTPKMAMLWSLAKWLIVIAVLLYILDYWVNHKQYIFSTEIVHKIASKHAGELCDTSQGSW